MVRVTILNNHPDSDVEAGRAVGRLLQQSKQEKICTSQRGMSSYRDVTKSICRQARFVKCCRNLEEERADTMVEGSTSQLKLCVKP